MLKIKEILIKLRLFKINYINLINFQKIIKGINFKINHMLVSSLVNPDLVIDKERLYQDYI
jgi:ribosomal protein L30/L7E